MFEERDSQEKKNQTKKKETENITTNYADHGHGHIRNITAMVAKLNMHTGGQVAND